MGAITDDGLKEWMKVPEFKAAFPKVLLLQWGMYAMKVEQLYAQQWKAANALTLTDYYASNGVGTVMLKGFAIGQYYPVPNHRASCDLDCFLKEDYEKGNTLVEKKKVKVDRGHYKHSTFDIKGLHVENHQFCTAIRGCRNRKAKEFLQLLQGILKKGPLTPIGESHLLCPPPMFNALFLTKHAMVHFLTEGITLRHYTDWAMFVQANREAVDWNEFVVICKEYGLFRFAEALTANCVRLLHIEAPFPVACSEAVQELMLQDTLHLGDRARLHEGKMWKQRLKLVQNIWRDRWKYKYFGDTSFGRGLWIFVYGFLFDRKPRI